MKLILICLLTLLSYSFQSHRITTRDYTELNSYSKRTKVFTQGLIYYNGKLYESGGLVGQSSISAMNYPPQSNGPFVYEELNKQYFAEGIAICNNYLYQLTWKNKKILIYSFNENQLQVIKVATMDSTLSEGWGLTSDGKKLYATNGSNNIYVSECDTTPSFKVAYSIVYNNQMINNLNALTFVDGVFYANRWFTDDIYKIKDGKVVKVYDFSLLVRKEFENKTFNRNYVLNGIACLKENTFIVTGKMWDNYYEIILN
jgi:glutamine cyclotransferase